MINCPEFTWAVNGGHVTISCPSYGWFMKMDCDPVELCKISFTEMGVEPVFKNIFDREHPSQLLMH